MGSLLEPTSIKYRPKKIEAPSSDVGFLPSYLQFHKWDASTNNFMASGTIHWTGTEWEPVGDKDQHFYQMEYLLSKERSFSDAIYSKNDHDFYKPFYHMPSSGTKVEISYVNPLSTTNTKDYENINPILNTTDNV